MGRISSSSQTYFYYLHCLGSWRHEYDQVVYIHKFYDCVDNLVVSSQRNWCQPLYFHVSTTSTLFALIPASALPSLSRWCSTSSNETVWFCSAVGTPVANLDYKLLSSSLPVGHIIHMCVKQRQWSNLILRQNRLDVFREKPQKVTDFHRKDVSPLRQGLNYRSACGLFSSELW